MGWLLSSFVRSRVARLCVSDCAPSFLPSPPSDRVERGGVPCGFGQSEHEEMLLLERMSEYITERACQSIANDGRFDARTHVRTYDKTNLGTHIRTEVDHILQHISGYT